MVNLCSFFNEYLRTSYQSKFIEKLLFQRFLWEKFIYLLTSWKHGSLVLAFAGQSGHSWGVITHQQIKNYIKRAFVADDRPQNSALPLSSGPWRRWSHLELLPGLCCIQRSKFSLAQFKIGWVNFLWTLQQNNGCFSGRALKIFSA